MRVSELWRLTVWILIPFGGVVTPQTSPAQQPTIPAAASGEEAPKKPSASKQLAEEQQQLADRYQQLEMLMLKMAEYDAASQPQRAALLKQALSRSKDHRISQQMVELAALIRDEQLRSATENQTIVRDQLAQILDLLLNENRAEQLKKEQDRVENYIKEVERILRQQRGVQGRTEGGDDPQRLAQDQGNIADRTQRLAKEIDENERPRGTAESAREPTEPKAPGEGESSQPAPGQNGNDQEPAKPGGEDDPADKPPSEKPPSDKPPGEKQSGDEPRPDENGSEPSDKPSEGQPSQDEPSEGQPSEGQPSEGEPSEGEPSEGQPSQGPPQPSGETPPEEPPEALPGQRQIQQALEQMREAQQRLEEAERQAALPAQQEARRLLEEAKAQLEEILRQMREEEIERALAQLEARFRKMLEMQIKVYEDTQQLSELKSPERASQIIVQSGRLNTEERRILQEADRALLLLREEGSSVAFPEAVEQMREDIESLADRLGQAKIDFVTLSLEEDIIAALEEIVEALQKAQQDAEQRRQQPSQPMQPMSPEDMPLVDAIAELKMIRALQVRVNKRTETFAGMLADPEHEVGQATDQDLIDLLNQLSQREYRIHSITRDLILEKNK